MTYQQVNSYIKKRGLNIDPVKCFKYWEDREWIRSVRTGTKWRSVSRPVQIYAEIVGTEQPEPVRTYREQLQDIRWKAFRDFILVVRGCRCENCGSTSNIQIHHPKYYKGRKPWEYTCNEVKVLCSNCHKKEHGL